MLDVICRRWWVLLLRGIVAILLGICAIVWPGITLLTLLWVFAVFTIVDGVAAIMLGIRGEADGTVWWTMVLLGVLAIVAGIVAGGYILAWPELALLVALVIVAASAIVRGILEIIVAIRLRKELDDEWILALSGFLSILFGALIIYRPDAGLLAVALLIGAYMISLGVLAMALSLRLRRICRSPKTSPVAR